MAATIRFDKPADPGINNRTRSDLVITDVVTITNVTPGTVNTFTLLARPAASSAALVGSGSASRTLTIDAVGTYKVGLIVDGAEVRHTFKALTVNHSLDIPSVNEVANINANLDNIGATPSYIEDSESNENNDWRGWMTALESNLLIIDDKLGTDEDAIHDNVASEISTISPKALPTNADFMLIEDAADSNNKKRVTIGDLPVSSATDAQAIHDNTPAEIVAITEKTSPAAPDLIIIEDSADSNNKKRVQVGNLPGDKLQFDISYTPVGDPEGEVRYNPDEGTLDICGDGTVLQAGFEAVTKVYNNSGSLIPNGAAVFLDQAVGGYPTVQLAKSDSHTTSRGVRVATQDIPNLSHGRITQRGKVRGVDTSGFIEGVPLWVSPTTAGEYTNTRPGFPAYSLFIGVASTIHASNGVINVELGSDLRDTFNNFHNGTFREPFNFNITSNGTVITGTLTPKNGHPDMTMLFSSGFSVLDTDPGATIALTAGTDTNPQTNYVYVLESTKLLAFSTSDWPITEHIKVAEVAVQTAATVQTQGALRNQNWNDEIQSTDNNQGHLSHIGERIRQEPSKWDSGTAGTLTIDATPAPDDLWLSITAGKVYQMHKQDFPVFDTDTAGAGDYVHIPNHFTTPYLAVQNLNGQTIDAAGNSLANSYFSFVLWGVVSSAGDPAQIMINLPIDAYNSSATAIADANNYSVYDIPKQFQGVGFLIARFTVYLNAAGNAWTLFDTQDLRGFIPNISAGGGGGGGGGVTEWTALTDTPSSLAGLGGYRPQVNSGGTALELVDEWKYINIPITACENGTTYPGQPESDNSTEPPSDRDREFSGTVNQWVWATWPTSTELKTAVNPEIQLTCRCKGTPTGSLYALEFEVSALSIGHSDPDGGGTPGAADVLLLDDMDSDSIADGDNCYCPSTSGVPGWVALDGITGLTAGKKVKLKILRDVSVTNGFTGGVGVSMITIRYKEVATT